MARPVPEVDRELGSRLQQLGYELVDVEWAGSSRRPIIRIRIDRGEGSGKEGEIGVDDCARASRSLEPWLDELESMPERYVLEVSSPGVDRPLLKPRDFQRFAGKKVAVKGPGMLAAWRASCWGSRPRRQGRSGCACAFPTGKKSKSPEGRSTGRI
jgi:ribosome maturation factor RimP